MQEIEYVELWPIRAPYRGQVRPKPAFAPQAPAERKVPKATKFRQVRNFRDYRFGLRMIFCCWSELTLRQS